MKLEQAARQVVANGVQGTYAKYYSVPPADFEALREALAEQTEQVSLPKLTDEVIADLWHQSGCHLHKFAKMLRDWLQENASR